MGKAANSRAKHKCTNEPLVVVANRCYSQLSHRESIYSNRARLEDERLFVLMELNFEV